MAIRILQWNCSPIRNKILELQLFLTFVNLPDYLCLQETYLNKETSFSLTGYHVIRKDRSHEKMEVFTSALKTLSFFRN